MELVLKSAFSWSIRSDFQASDLGTVIEVLSVPYTPLQSHGGTCSIPYSFGKIFLLNKMHLD